MDVINTEVPGKYPGYFCIIRVLSDSNKVRSRRAQGPARSALNQGPQDLERPLVDIPSGFERFEVSECLRIPRSVQNHEFNLTALKKVFAIIIPQTLLFQFIEYLGIPFIILLFCLILCIILEKYMPGLYNLISGGRRDIKVSNYCDIFYR